VAGRQEKAAAAVVTLTACHSGPAAGFRL